MGIHIKNVLAVIDGKVKRTDIYIDGNIIAGVGEIPEGFSADTVIDGTDRLASAGLVNTHTHTYMSLYRNYADDLSFSDWLFGNISPLEDRTTPDDAYVGATLACAEMIRTGTTTFVDMHMFRGMTCRAADECGMRAVISRGLCGEGDDEGGQRRLDEAFGEMEEYKNNSRLTFMLAPHAIYTCDTDYLKKVIALAGERKLPINIHLSETRYEVSQAVEKYGVSPVKYLDDLGMFGIKTLAAHCVHISDEDIKILADRGVSVAANPKSNMKLGNGFAPIKKLLDSGVNVCIGTDSAASNNSLNMFSDMNFTALVHKGTGEDAQAVSAVEVHRMATENGAAALGINAGKIEKGMLADIILLDLNTPQFNPRNNLVAAMSYSATGSETDTVIIDGKIVMRDKKLLTIDEEKLYYEANKIMERLRKEG